MIKKFNENWDTFRDFLDDNEPISNPNMDGEIEMDTIADYAKRKNISYDHAKTLLASKQQPIEPPKKIEWNDGYEVIGLPSGQIIYMSTKQIAYFKARNLVMWKITWKKPLAGGFVPIKIEKHCFEDKLLPNILDQMNLIVW